MVFSDLLFLFVFLPFFALTYLLGTWIDKKRIKSAELTGREPHRRMLWRNVALIIFSILFYSWGEPIYMLLMLFSVVVNYISGLFIGNSNKDSVRKTWMIIGVAADLAILGSFKYLGFFASSLASIGIPVPVPQLALPIGISFYIFQSISYIVDVYRKDSPYQKNFFDLLLYISMFPQLIAGPIVRYGTVAEEIHHRTVNLADVSEGTYRFFIGLGKKVIFANIMGEIATQLIGGLGGSFDHLTFWDAWIGIIAFGLQVYFDFSGYSDMAIGLGRTVGFHFPENFTHPYTATSTTDFWRKWHISLGSFFRDYLYIPLGGNRKHQMLNILTVWFLTGLWHGASWNFVLWGLYFGMILLIEKYTVLRWNMPKILSHVYTIFVLAVGYAIFYFDDFGKLGEFYKAFFGLNGDFGAMPMNVQSLIFDNFWLWVTAIALCLPIRKWMETKAEKFAASGPVYVSHGVLATRAVVSFLILAASVALLVGATNNAFLYTRF